MKRSRTGKNLIALFLVMMPLLIGAKFLDLELRNVKGDPLVDMTLLVNGNSLKAEPADPDAIDEVQDEADKNEETKPNVTVTPSKKDYVSIRVSREQIYIDNQLSVGKPFDKAFEEVYKKGMSVEVTDDYADYQAMMKVVNYLDEAGIFYSIKETR
jgi:hypothetical protein